MRGLAERFTRFLLRAWLVLRVGAALALALPCLGAVLAVGLATPAWAATTQTAVFAGGCFWCVEADFDKLPGVVRTTSGYAGGHDKQPTYGKVSAGTTGHTEVVQVEFDPQRISYAQLVEHFWKTIDPSVKDRQFCDTGSQYRTAIFYTNAEQKQQAQASKKTLEASKRFAVVYTELAPLDVFYPAEAEHQNYHQTNPVRYQYYRRACGRDARLQQLWK